MSGHRWQKSGLTGEGLNTVVIPRLGVPGTTPAFCPGEKLPCCGKNIAGDGIRDMRNDVIQAECIRGGGSGNNGIVAISAI